MLTQPVENAIIVTCLEKYNNEGNINKCRIVVPELGQVVLSEGTLSTNSTASSFNFPIRSFFR